MNNREARIVRLAKEAGFDDDGLAYTEFSLVPFFDKIVEECAMVAELQSRVYTGEHNEGAGCMSAASAIRVYGRKTDE